QPMFAFADGRTYRAAHSTGCVISRPWCAGSILNSSTACLMADASSGAYIRPRYCPFARIIVMLMSRSQERIARAVGVTREGARHHLVRGVRRTGVYWWSPFLWGDASRPIKSRASYEVVR